MTFKRIKFDPRAQLLLLLAASVVSFWADRYALLWIIGFMAAYLLVQGMYKNAVRFGLLAVAFFLIQGWSSYFAHGLITFVSFFAFLGLRLLPVLMAASALGNTPSGQLIAALRTLRIPMGVLIALAVGSRFLPVMRTEFEAIQLSARLRGLSVASPRNWLRPLRTFEYAIVPLLMRSLKISDELAASATTKGIDHPGRKTSLYPVVWQGQDVAVLMLFIIGLIALVYFGGLS
ncbi:energy-coupling factor transporter transmembrane component T family protein [Cohnella hongkongensis]|uniref:Energy-coupling factor transporter transmembrane component T family protein n=1 Tax=Cohnella hongkongensis TaxID=178337 RepID=A0ABV9FJT1_9BACL